MNKIPGYKNNFLSNKPIKSLSHTKQPRKHFSSFDQSLYNFNNSFDTIFNSMGKSLKKLKKQYKNIPIPTQESYLYNSHIPEDLLDA